MNEETKHSSPEREQEKAWIEAFLAGDRDAFDELVLKYKDRVFNLCFRFLGNYEDAGDCAQDTFVKVYKSLKKFRFNSSFSTWLYTVTVNTCKNKLKSVEHRNRKKMLSINPKKEGEEGRAFEIEDPSPSPLEQLAKKEKEILLQKAIDTLPKEAKTVLILRDIQGLSYEEIGGITGYNLGTVKSKLSRARRQLREKVREMI